MDVSGIADCGVCVCVYALYCILYGGGFIMELSWGHRGRLLEVLKLKVLSVTRTALL